MAYDPTAHGIRPYGHSIVCLLRTVRPCAKMESAVPHFERMPQSGIRMIRLVGAHGSPEHNVGQHHYRAAHERPCRHERHSRRDEKALGHCKRQRVSVGCCHGYPLPFPDGLILFTPRASCLYRQSARRQTLRGALSSCRWWHAAPESRPYSRWQCM